MTWLQSGAPLALQRRSRDLLGLLVTEMQCDVCELRVTFTENLNAS